MLGMSEQLANRVTLKLNELIDKKIDALNKKIEAALKSKQEENDGEEKM